MSLSSFQLAGIISMSLDPHYQELELSSSYFLSARGGGSARSHGPDDVGSYVGSEESELRTPPLQVNSHDHDDRELRGPRDVMDRHPDPPSTELIRGKGVVGDHPRENQNRRHLVSPIDFQDPTGGREYEMVREHRVELDPSEHVIPHGLRFAGPQPKISGLPHPDEGFICCEANALALAQAVDNANLANQRSLNIAGQLINVTEEAIVDRNAAWKKVKNLEEEITGLRERHKELSDKYAESENSVRHLEGSLKKAETQSSSRLTALRKAESKCEELEREIGRLEKKIVELEQQRPSSMYEMVKLWQAYEEGKDAIVELSRFLLRLGITWPIGTLLLIFLKFPLTGSGMVFPGLTMILV
ncbi:hypothetical protein Dimus_018491 [Dionaea muscipula]